MTDRGDIGARDPGYFGHVRRDVLDLVPSKAARVLSVGCGAGATEEVLVRRGLEVVGLEFDPDAAVRAKARGIDVHCGDAMENVHGLEDSRFDVLLCADVLEHLADPEAFLASVSCKLQPSAAVVISVPNFRSFRVFWHLFVLGELPRVDSGIFDRTHLQVTTLHRVKSWLKLLGARPGQVDYRMNRRSKVLAGITGGVLRELLAVQLVVAGRRGGEGK